tara:strand:+ start:2943 stop:3785 length:843 start_codon:yes stop_codon:yes gene_type:complete
MNIIGLGKAGCKIAELFNQYSQYTVFKLDSDEKLKRKKNCIYIPTQGSVELYDSNPVNLNKLKKNLDDDKELYFILCGTGKVAGSSLWILRELSDYKINIIYIKPNLETVDNKSKLRHRVHFHVLQEYARSGVFERFIIIDNTMVSDIIGKTSILNYYNNINKFILNTIHWLNIYNNTEPVFDTYRDEIKTSRICTLSFVDMEEEEEREIFFLKNCNKIKYFYGVNRIKIESDDNLLEKVNRISTKDKEDKTSISYGIYPTDLDTGVCFALKSSSTIQQE